MSAKIDSVVSLPTSGYRITWDDGLTMDVGDDLGMELMQDLARAQFLRASVDRETCKPGRHFSDAEIDEIADQLGIVRER